MSSGFCEVSLVPSVKQGKQLIGGFCKYSSHKQRDPTCSLEPDTLLSCSLCLLTGMLYWLYWNDVFGKTQA